MIGNIVAAITGGLAEVGDFESIETVIVGSGGASSITFSTIPSTFQHLQIRAIGRSNFSGSTGGDYAKVTFNGDTGANYALHYLQGDGSSVVSAGFANTNWINILRFAVNAADGATNTFGVSVSDILDYANTNKFKTFRSLGGTEMNTGNTQGAIPFQSGLWRNTNAITSITLTPGNGTAWTQHTHVALYGIRG